MATTFEKVKDIIVKQLGVKPEEVTEEANFTDDLGADSLDLVEVVMALEEEFGAQVPDEEAEKIKTRPKFIRGAFRGSPFFSRQAQRLSFL